MCGATPHGAPLPPWLGVLAALLLRAAAAAAPAGDNLVPLSALPLRTRKRFVVDTAGRRVQLACVNWYGAQQKQMVMNGLDARPLDEIAATIASLRFNCVRLPFSLDLVFTNRTTIPAPEETLRANPALQRLSPLELFDATVAGLTRVGLLVVINQHISTAGWCCSNTDGEGLWYTTRYPEDDWLRALGIMAARYRGNPRVMGFDIRNEVRPSFPMIPGWGTNDVATDWALAAAKGGKRVLAENDHMLVVISGIQFGMRLAEVPGRPIHETEQELQGRTIYTTHFYYGWCFDLMAYDMVGRQIPTLMGLACWLWLLLAADGHRAALGVDGAGLDEYETVPAALEYDGAPPSALPPLGQRAWAWCWSCFAGGRLEWVIAVVLLVLLCVFFAIGKYLGQTCGHIHIISPPAFAVLSSICFHLIFLLWTRILLAYTYVLMPSPLCSGDGPLAATVRSLMMEDQLDIRSPRTCSGLGAVEAKHCEPEAPETAQEPLESGPGKPPLPVEPGAVSRCADAARCGASASRRLVGPLRKRRRAAAAGALVFLAVVELVGRQCGSYGAFVGELDACWGFLLGGKGVAEAPIWLSEFGTDNYSNYWKYLMRYMGERELDFAYWSINGEKRYHENESYSLLKDDWVTVRHPWKLESLQRLILTPGREAPTSGPP